MRKRPAVLLESQAQLAERLFSDGSWLDDAGRYEEAFQLFRAGAELGDSSAQVSLGNCYSSGVGTKKSISLAEYWYKKAYKSGVFIAANNLAIDKKRAGDTRSAIFWFKRAISLGDNDALVELAKIYLKHSQRTSAITLLKKAASLKPYSEITAYGHEEAVSLLKKVTSSKV